MNIIESHREAPSPYEMKAQRQGIVQLEDEWDDWKPLPEQDQSRHDLYAHAMAMREQVIRSHAGFWSGRRTA